MVLWYEDNKSCLVFADADCQPDLTKHTIQTHGILRALETVKAGSGPLNNILYTFKKRLNLWMQGRIVHLEYREFSRWAAGLSGLVGLLGL